MIEIKKPKIERIAKGVKPLCYLPDGKLVCYRHGWLLIYNGTVIVSRDKIFNSLKECFLSRDRLLFRALRLGVRSGFAINNEVVLLSISNSIYEYNLATKSLSNGFCLSERIRPLAFTEIKKIPGFQEGIVFGGYLVNPSKKPVCIYRRKGVDQWEVIYTFKEGAINHVHNIVPDPIRECVWILTGDSDDSAAIWRTSDDFRSLHCVKSGNQKYRACFAFSIKEGLLLATDSPNDQNWIEILKENGELDQVCTISGSCIYGCKWGSKIVLSSTVEPDSTIKRSLIKGLLNREKGSGIQDYYSHIYIGDLISGFVDVVQFKKDFLPYSFQLGTTMFPAGENSSGVLICYPVATSFDNSLIAISL